MHDLLMYIEAINAVHFKNLNLLCRNFGKSFYKWRYCYVWFSGGDSRVEGSTEYVATRRASDDGYLDIVSWTSGAVYR